ncbi:MAG: methyltransferase domain-containing protein [Pseudorhodobacter sp.]|nr:methyltransferase domain-containing protein [Pseudorhodobacter sp.]
MSDWSPSLYARFGGLRRRPALDLLAQVGGLPEGDVVDLGCGNGAAGPALAARFAGRGILGLDASPAMLSEAAATGVYADCQQADVAAWTPARAPALIFSNAVLHWLPDHAALLPRLAGFLAPGGTLAVQMPRQHGAPSHRFLRDFAAEMFPDRFDGAAWQPPVLAAPDYLRLLAPLGQADVWETEYVQRLGANGTGHPVRRFTEATAMRPYLEKLSAPEAAAYVARYDAALAAAYPAEADGSVLFPFRRLFFTLRRHAAAAA